MVGNAQPHPRPFLRSFAASLLALAVGAAGCGRSEIPAPQAPGAAALAPVGAPFSPDQVQAVLRTLSDAPNQGFAPGAFGDVQKIAGLIQSGDPAQQAEGQGRLRAAIIAYARAQHGRGLPTRDFPKEWGMRPSPYDASLELRAAMGQNRLGDWLRSQPPPPPRYAALIGALAAYRKVAAQGGWPTVPEGPPLRLRSRGARVEALRERLAFEDGAVAALPPRGVYGAALAQAVIRFQAGHGLKTTGFVGPETYQALNVPAAARVNQIRANLERWRWTPRDPPDTRIEVDAASGTLDYFKDGQVAMHMLAAAGKPGDETPILASQITDVVLNPSWRVPADIAEKELYPKEHRHPGYFARAGFVPGASDVAPLVQKPGPKNALGQVKFEFDSAYGVYLHDTPTKSAFNLAQRSVSHGCVRLQRAVDLAKELLSSNPDWPPQRVDQALAAADTQAVALARPVPLMLFYWTAHVEDGHMVLRQDPYGWDDLVVRLLDAGSSGQG